MRWYSTYSFTIKKRYDIRHWRWRTSFSNTTYVIPTIQTGGGMAVHCQDGWLCHLHRPSCRLHSHNSGFTLIYTHMILGITFLRRKLFSLNFLIWTDLFRSLPIFGNSSTYWGDDFILNISEWLPQQHVKPFKLQCLQYLRMNLALAVLCGHACTLLGELGSVQVWN